MFMLLYIIYVRGLVVREWCTNEPDGMRMLNIWRGTLKFQTFVRGWHTNEPDGMRLLNICAWAGLMAD